MTLKYNTGDVNEMLIRILSFGPMLEVVASKSARNMTKQRIMKQKICVE